MSGSTITRIASLLPNIKDKPNRCANCHTTMTKLYFIFASMNPYITSGHAHPMCQECFDKYLYRVYHRNIGDNDIDKVSPHNMYFEFRVSMLMGNASGWHYFVYDMLEKYCNENPI